jgi:biotin operon repressor
MIRGLLETAELHSVSKARSEGHSWNEIATALGVSRQSAWEKWRDDVSE